MKVWIVEGEHFSVPGVIRHICANESAATKYAIDLTEMLQEDEFESSDQQIVTAANWRGIAQEIAERHDGECHVELTTHEVEA